MPGLLITTAQAQIPSKIRVRSSDLNFYFFQKGTPSDTISPGKHDMFYLKIPADKRCTMRIDVENGELRQAGSDTLYRLVHVGTINYTHYYADSVYYGAKQFDKHISKCHQYKVLINGINSHNPSAVTVRFYDSTKDSLLLTNHFYYR